MLYGISPVLPMVWNRVFKSKWCGLYLERYSVSQGPVRTKVNIPAFSARRAIHKQRLSVLASPSFVLLFGGFGLSVEYSHILERVVIVYSDHNRVLSFIYRLNEPVWYCKPSTNGMNWLCMSIDFWPIYGPSAAWKNSAEWPPPSDHISIFAGPRLGLS